MNHGTTTGYGKGCRCEPCTRANRLRMLRWQVRTRRGESLDKVPIDPVREHVHRLRASGWTLPAIAEETGVSFHTVKVVTANRTDRRHVHRWVAASLLALQPLERVDVDPVVVDRLVAAYPNRVWDSLGATRAERVAAAEVLDARGHQVRRHLRDAGYGDQQIETPSRTGIEDALSLRMGRDFAIRSAS